MFILKWIIKQRFTTGIKFNKFLKRQRFQKYILLENAWKWLKEKKEKEHILVTI